MYNILWYFSHVARELSTIMAGRGGGIKYFGKLRGSCQMYEGSQGGAQNFMSYSDVLWLRERSKHISDENSNRFVTCTIRENEVPSILLAAWKR